MPALAMPIVPDSAPSIRLADTPDDRFERFQRMARNRARRYWPRSEDAEQTAYAGLWGACVSFDGPSEDFPEFARQAVNRALDRLPSDGPLGLTHKQLRELDRRVRPVPEVLSVSGDELSNVVDPGDETPGEDIYQHVHTALARLTPDNREVLYRLYGLTEPATPELALSKELGITRGKLAARIKRALNAARAALTEPDPTPDETA